MNLKCDFKMAPIVCKELSTEEFLIYRELFTMYVDCHSTQRYTYRVLQTIQMKLILLCVWAEWAALDSAKTALKFKYEI